MNENPATDKTESQEPAIATARRKAGAAANPSADGVLLDRLLVMAHDYRSTGDLNQAMEMYWSLHDNYPGTMQARSAGVSLLEVAQGYESAGSKRMARSIYTRLL